MSDAPVRVLSVIDSLRTGGAEWMLASLLGELRAADAAEPTVVVPSLDDADPELRARVEAVAGLVGLGTRRLAEPALYRGLGRVARATRAQLVHSHLSTANIASRLVARGLRLPHMTTIHTTPGPKAHDLPRHTLVNGWTSRLSVRLVAPTATISRSYAARWRVPEERMRVIGNPPAAAAAPTVGREVTRRELGVGPAERLVLCVSRLHPEKGIAELVEATALLRDRGIALRVAVAGGGEAEGELAALIARQGLEDRVALLGRRPDVADLLAAADVFCLPSRHEGLPLSVLEALRAGLPCVATAVGGVPDVVVDGETGLLVPPSDPPALAAAMARALEDRALVARLALAGPELVAASFAPAVVAERYAALYHEILAG